jgi:hypothetical protein
MGSLVQKNLTLLIQVVTESIEMEDKTNWWNLVLNQLICTSKLRTDVKWYVDMN